MEQKLKVITDYSHKCDLNSRSCFYYAEGNVILIFDYTDDCLWYFATNPDILKYTREIFFCYSSKGDIEARKRDIDRIFDHLPEVNKKYTVFSIMNHGVFGYTRIGLLHDKIIEYSGRSFGIKTNEAEICLIANHTNLPDHVNYTVWEQGPLIMRPYLFYTGLSGELSTVAIANLTKDPNVRVMFYINHDVMFGPENPSNETVNKKLLNTMYGLRNKIRLLGFRSEAEKMYLQNLWKDDV